MLIICLGMLYKNGVIMHLNNLLYGFLILVIGEFIYIFFKENTLVLLNSHELTDIFLQVIRVGSVILGFSIMLDPMRY